METPSKQDDFDERKQTRFIYFAIRVKVEQLKLSAKEYDDFKLFKRKFSNALNILMI